MLENRTHGRPIGLVLAAKQLSGFHCQRIEPIDCNVWINVGGLLLAPSETEEEIAIAELKDMLLLRSNLQRSEPKRSGRKESRRIVMRPLQFRSVKQRLQNFVIWESFFTYLYYLRV